MLHTRVHAGHIHTVIAFVSVTNDCVGLATPFASLSFSAAGPKGVRQRGVSLITRVFGTYFPIWHTLGTVIVHR